MNLDTGTADGQQFVTVMVAGSLIGLPILDVQDIVVPDRLARVPRAPAAVAGLMNLRGRIVTAIDLRTLLGLPPAPAGRKRYGVTVTEGQDTYNLLVDGVGDVVVPDPDTFEPCPQTLDPRWRKVAEGVFRLPGKLMVTLDVRRVVAAAAG